MGSGSAALYTIWRTGTRGEILFAVMHCTAGDALITAAALLLAILIARLLGWPLFGGRMVLAAVLLGLGYTVFSEWLNVKVRQSWSYTEAMPLLPPFGTGLAPFLQWLAVPGLAFAITASRGRRAHRLPRRGARLHLEAVLCYAGIGDVFKTFGVACSYP